MKKIVFLFTLILLTSCGSFQLSTINHSPIVTQEGIVVDVIDSEFSLYRKLSNDSRFRWDYTKFAMDQDLRWHYSFYSRNNLWRYNRNISPWDLYVNKYDYWFNWNFNFGFSTFNHWDPYRFRQWGWNSYDPYYSNFHLWNRPSIAHMNRYRQSNQIDIENRERNNRVRSRAIVTNNSNNNNVRVYTRPELNEDKLRESVNLLKGRNSNIIVREYNNPNNIENDKIIRSNPRIYVRPEGGSNGGRVWSRENTPPPSVRPQVSPPNQSRQIRGGSNTSSVQQTRTSSKSSGPRSSGPRR